MQEDQEFEGHPWIHGESEVCLGYRDLVSNNKTIKRINENIGLPLPIFIIIYIYFELSF